MKMQVLSNFFSQIRDAQKEALETNNLKNKSLNGPEKILKLAANGVWKFKDRVWIPCFGNLRELVLEEAHKSKYLIHPGSDKMYKDLKMHYWWSGMKKEIALYVSKCLTCSRVKAEYQKPLGFLQQPEISEWKWD